MRAHRAAPEEQQNRRGAARCCDKLRNKDAHLLFEGCAGFSCGPGFSRHWLHAARHVPRGVGLGDHVRARRVEGCSLLPIAKQAQCWREDVASLWCRTQGSYGIEILLAEKGRNMVSLVTTCGKLEGVNPDFMLYFAPL